MKLNDITERLNCIAPLHFSEEWDNVGLLLRPLKPRTIKRVLLTIDLTEAVANEAVAKKTDLIISYHPILFQAIQRLDAEQSHDRTVMRLVQKNIAVYSPHTALDAVIGGVNDWLADAVGEGDVSMISSEDNDLVGAGRVVALKRPVKLKTLTGRIKQYLGLKTVRIAGGADNRPIKTVALCAGAGSSVFKGMEADCYLTGEMSHHSILTATQNGSHVILCEHTNSERGYLPRFRQILQKALGNEIDISVSEIDSDPITFH